ncbi:hypothetical protein BGAL_0302g00140 [Botrytis galanthina]|uniref:Uncharacterized protein n=1 Tax=Botrytis galanthina TaxID=278940 RepID=A0A4S8QTC5_9HELO|nr:hypothetical protein BGAL_0302g00140 [Botrytis galanthina]
MAFYLPQDQGVLPYFLLFNAIISFYNSAQCFSSLPATRKLFFGPHSTIPLSTSTSTSTSPKTASPSSHEATALFARTFGCYTLVSGMLRLITAYNLSSPELYFLTLWAYVVIAGFWGMEWLYFGTVAFGPALCASIVIDGGAVIIMLWGWGKY